MCHVGPGMPILVAFVSICLLFSTCPTGLASVPFHFKLPLYPLSKLGGSKRTTED